MRKKYLLKATAAMLTAMLALTACNNTNEQSASETSASGGTKAAITTPAATTASTEKKTTINLYGIIFSYADKTDSLNKQTQAEVDEVSAESISKALSEWIGLDFFINGAVIDGDTITVDWSADSTLVKGLDDREQKDEFHTYDVVGTNELMLDSMAETLKANLPVSYVCYSYDGGKELLLYLDTEQVSLGTDVPYLGSDNMKGIGSPSDMISYTDPLYGFTVTYPDTFSDIPEDNYYGGIFFNSVDGGTVRVFFTIVSSKGSINNEMEMFDDVVYLDDTSAVSYLESMNQETGEYSYGAYYTTVFDGYTAFAAFVSESGQAALDMFDKVKNGALYITHPDMIVVEFESNAEALEILTNALGDEVLSGKSLEAEEDMEINGEHAFVFSLVYNDENGLSVYDSTFAVGDSGSIYVYSKETESFIERTEG